MKAALTLVPALFAVGGAGPAAVAALVLVLAHAARSPDRLVDLAYAATSCAVGYAVG